jgi:quinolinate synthase
MPKKDLISKIKKLKSDRGAVLLVHNYQPPEIQDMADHLGDSLDLSRLAQELQSGVIVFCGVRFMAETASILSPDKTVILPEPDAGCPMADMITADDVIALRADHPAAAIVMYVNSTAAVKAHTDICCTSANAVKVIESIPKGKEIIFGPDFNLGSWVAEQTDREMILWKGFCPPHQKILPEHISALKKRHPKALVMVHPEVLPATAAESDAVLGTSGMIRFAGESGADTFIVGTEAGMCYRLEKEYPAKRFIPATADAVCRNMKKITLEKILHSLETLEPQVRVPRYIADPARAPIQRMIEII